MDSIRKKYIIYKSNGDKQMMREVLTVSSLFNWVSIFSVLEVKVY